MRKGGRVVLRVTPM